MFFLYLYLRSTSTNTLSSQGQICLELLNKHGGSIYPYTLTQSQSDYASCHFQVFFQKNAKRLQYGGEQRQTKGETRGQREGERDGTFTNATAKQKIDCIFLFCEYSLYYSSTNGWNPQKAQKLGPSFVVAKICHLCSFYFVFFIMFQDDVNKTVLGEKTQGLKIKIYKND